METNFSKKRIYKNKYGQLVEEIKNNRLLFYGFWNTIWYVERFVSMKYEKEV